MEKLIVTITVDTEKAFTPEEIELAAQAVQIHFAEHDLWDALSRSDIEIIKRKCKPYQVRVKHRGRRVGKLNKDS